MTMLIQLLHTFPVALAFVGLARVLLVVLHDPKAETWKQRYAWCKAQIAQLELAAAEDELARQGRCLGQWSGSGRRYNAKRTRPFGRTRTRRRSRS